MSLSIREDRMGFHHYHLPPSNSDALKTGQQLLMMPQIGVNLFQNRRHAKRYQGVYVNYSNKEKYI